MSWLTPVRAWVIQAALWSGKCDLESYYRQARNNNHINLVTSKRRVTSGIIRWLLRAFINHHLRRKSLVSDQTELNAFPFFLSHTFVEVQTALTFWHCCVYFSEANSTSSRQWNMDMSKTSHVFQTFLVIHSRAAMQIAFQVFLCRLQRQRSHSRLWKIDSLCCCKYRQHYLVFWSFRWLFSFTQNQRSFKARGHLPGPPSR